MELETFHHDWYKKEKQTSTTTGRKRNAIRRRLDSIRFLYVYLLLIRAHPICKYPHIVPHSSVDLSTCWFINRTASIMALLFVISVICFALSFVHFLTKPVSNKKNALTRVCEYRKTDNYHQSIHRSWPLRFGPAGRIESWPPRSPICNTKCPSYPCNTTTLPTSNWNENCKRPKPRGNNRKRANYRAASSSDTVRKRCWRSRWSWSR